MLKGTTSRRIGAPGTFTVFSLLAAWAVAGAPLRAEETGKIDFDRQVRPILADKCFFCHGPDEGHRKADLRLDIHEGLFGESDDGAIVVPGKPEESELYLRITHRNPRRRMPPAKTGKSLTEEEVATIRKWIEQGAEWQEHWSFVPPKRPSIPQVRRKDWPRTPIDNFVLARLERERLAPSPEADRRTLIRRLALDLTGLPPTLEEVRQYLEDPRPDALERAADRYLASPRYGEHRARYWLDAARYGDTHGLHLDNYREMWPYRDWVIKAFNRNLAYDRFITEQLAGDLLPNPTLDQLIATGFNRAHVTTNEGGSIVEEVYVRNVVDRVSTFGVVFLGLGLGCAVCHDHKYDPITQRDFYQLFAFFNSLDGSPMDGNRKDPPPVVRVPTPELLEEIERYKREIEETEREIRNQLARFEYEDPGSQEPPPSAEPREIVWVDDEVPEGARAEGKWTWVEAPGKPVLSGKRAMFHAAEGLSQHYFHGAKKTLRLGEGDVLFAHVYLDPADPPREIMLQWNDGSWEHRAYWGENLIDWGQDGTPSRRRIGDLPETGEWVRLEVPAALVGLGPGTELNGWAFTQHGGKVYWDRAGVLTRADQAGTFVSLAAWVESARKRGGGGIPEELKSLVEKPAASLSLEEARRLRDYFIEHVYAGSREIFDPLHKRIEELRKKIAETEKRFPTTLVWKERKDPKPAYVLIRGQYDRHGEQVERNTPAALPPMPPDAPRDRLGLAMWLTQADHPLTARVEVNRLWQEVFGTGIVKTSEEFGNQGERPSHPLLLDWLATEFVRTGWNIKYFLRTVVSSAVYRQTAEASPELIAKDPANRLLARGPRFRLDAEAIRDQALALSGLLYGRIGGPSVKPPQPPGLWYAVGYTSSNTARFVADKGHDKVHRRSLYTFWKRTSPPPEMAIFDAPSREACTVRRERTNTPLQALVLLNDPQFFECARAMAERVLEEGGSTDEGRLAYAFELATARPPDAEELAVLKEALEGHREDYRDALEAAKKVISVGELPPDPRWEPRELAAWTMVCNLILNLDEVLNKG